MWALIRGTLSARRALRAAASGAAASIAAAANHLFGVASTAARTPAKAQPTDEVPSHFVFAANSAIPKRQDGAIDSECVQEVVVEQLLVGVLLAAPLIALLPTTVAFAALFAVLHHIVVAVQVLLRTAICALDSAPLLPLLLWLLQPLLGATLLPAGLHIEAMRGGRGHTRVTSSGRQQQEERQHRTSGTLHGIELSRDRKGPAASVHVSVRRGRQPVACAQYALHCGACPLARVTAALFTFLRASVLPAWRAAGGASGARTAASPRHGPPL